MAALRFVNAKNLNEYISEENMLTCWGGLDDYQFEFSPEQNGPIYPKASAPNSLAVQKDENDNTTLSNSNKKVCGKCSKHISFSPKREEEIQRELDKDMAPKRTDKVRMQWCL